MNAKPIKTIVKYIADLLFVSVLSLFLIFLLFNIAYSKRDEVKLGLMTKLSDFQISFRDLVQQGSLKAQEFKLAYKNNRLS